MPIHADEHSLYLPLLVGSISSFDLAIFEKEIHRTSLYVAASSVHCLVGLKKNQRTQWQLRLKRYCLCFFALAGADNDVGTRILRFEYERRHGKLLLDGWIVMNYWVSNASPILSIEYSLRISGKWLKRPNIPYNDKLRLDYVRHFFYRYLSRFTHILPHKEDGKYVETSSQSAVETVHCGVCSGMFTFINNNRNLIASKNRVLRSELCHARHWL